jgi:hypothetical protein
LSGRENVARAWFKVVAAVHLFLIRDGKVLLLRRFNRQIKACSARSLGRRGHDHEHSLSHACRAKVAGADFRGSQVEGLRVEGCDLRGVVIDPTQAVVFAGLLGLVVRWNE